MVRAKRRSCKVRLLERYIWRNLQKELVKEVEYMISGYSNTKTKSNEKAIKISYNNRTEYKWFSLINI
jgi:hypothetical protein